MESPYMSSREHLADELKRLDLLLRLNISGEDQQDALNQYAGMVISAEEIHSLLDGGTTEEEPDSLLQKLTSLNLEISKRREASRQKGIHLSLPYISEKLNLSPLEERCIMICLAPELDRKYEKVYSFLQNDMTLKSPTIHLILQLFTENEEERISARQVFDLQAPLVRFLMELRSDLTDNRIPLIARPLKLDDWVVNYLLDIEILDSRLIQIAQMVSVGSQVQDKLLNTNENKIIDFIKYYKKSKEEIKQLIYFYGPDGAGKRNHVMSVCSNLRLPVISVEVEKILASDIPFGEILRLLGRQVMLGDYALRIENFDCLITEDGRNTPKLNRLLQMISEYSHLTFILGRSQWNLAIPDTKFAFIGVEFPYLSENERRTYWENLSKKYGMAKSIDLESFSNNFRFTPGQIHNALSIGENLSVWQGAVDGQIGEEELYNACYSQSNQKLGTLAVKIKKTYTWDMLVLPPEQTSQLQEICNQVKYRSLVYEKWGFDRRLSLGKGLNVLFSGPPGSGKTMSAEVIASELGLEIYKIDVSQVVSKYIGETEKNLSEIFDEAETSNAILFFDEADALFGKRSDVKDAHDRYANVEISYLLQKMEEYKGIVILATNLNQNIDEAFLRRLHFNVAFPFPEKEQRKEIWKGIFPTGAPLNDDLDYDFMAEKFTLAGGNIKNIALNAAFYAAHSSSPIGMKQIMLSAKREYKKLGKIFLKSDYEPYYELIEVMN